MFLRLFLILVIINTISGKPIIIRNVSDCSITDDGILHYYGKHSFSKFEHECLLWSDFQTNHSNIINEANFLHDISIKAAKNYCRNPNMNINGPWCFVEKENDIVTMEQCDVCQSLARQSTLPTDINLIDDVTHETIRPGFFENLHNDIKRFGTYLRKKFWEIIERIRNQFQQLGSKFSNYFNG